MNFYTILLVSLFVLIRPWQNQGLKRIKRLTDWKFPNEEIHKNFVKLNEREEKPAVKKNLKYFEYLKNSLNNSNTAIIKNQTAAVDFKQHPLTILLNETESQLAQTTTPEYKLSETAHQGLLLKSQNLGNKSNVKEANDFKDKFCAVNKHSKKYFIKHHKVKHPPHVIHSTALGEAKVLMPSANAAPFLHTDYTDFNSIASMEQLMNMGNMLMFKMGMDSLPHAPKLFITQNAPFMNERKQFSEQTHKPNSDLIFKTLEKPKKNLFDYQKNPIENTIVGGTFKMPLLAAIKEPLQVLSMEDNENETEMEFSCPIHHSRQNPNYLENENVVQVCSCRFIKTPNDRETKTKANLLRLD